MKILIVGAGIGGLTAALCLAKSGHEVKIFEQTSEFSEVGAGIQCGANALHVLDHLGLLPALKSLAVDPQAVQFRDYKNGSTFYRMQLGEHYREQYGQAYWHLHRADLHSILVDAVRNKIPSCLELDATVTGYTESKDNVSLELANGEVVVGSCLVAADGVRSSIRKQLLQDSSQNYEPKFTGNVAWRAVVPAGRLPDEWMDKITSNFVGPSKHAVLYYLRNQQLANFVGVVENTQWLDDSWVVNSPWNEMQADFADWHPTVQAIIDAADKGKCYRWALYDHKPLANWSSGRVTLLGDAAHATLPFMASGAAMAIEDGRILQRSIDQTNSIADALALYQRNRIPRTSRIQNTSAKMGKLYHLENKFLQTSAFKMLGLLGGRAESFLPKYNANTVELL